MWGFLQDAEGTPRVSEGAKKKCGGNIGALIYN